MQTETIRKNTPLIIGILFLIALVAFAAFWFRPNEPRRENQTDPGIGIEPAPAPDKEPITDEGEVFCTMDAMECPDGSWVGRVPPSCEFAPCP